MYHFEWLQAALDELAQAWNLANAEQRKAITQASHLLEQRLQVDPLGQSESRPGGRRVTFVPPLAATFRIEADGKTVTVLHVRVFRRRKK